MLFVWLWYVLSHGTEANPVCGAHSRRCLWDETAFQSNQILKRSLLHRLFLSSIPTECGASRWIHNCSWLSANKCALIANCSVSSQTYFYLFAILSPLKSTPLIVNLIWAFYSVMCWLRRSVELQSLMKPLALSPNFLWLCSLFWGVQRP